MSNGNTNTQLWLALKLVPRLAIHKKIALVDTFDLAALFSFNGKSSILTSANGLSTKQLSAFYQPDWQKISTIIQASSTCNSTIVCFDEACYPQLLKQIYDPPLVIFIQGNASLLNAQQLAVVGSRAASAGAGRRRHRTDRPHG